MMELSLSTLKKVETYINKRYDIPNFEAKFNVFNCVDLLFSYRIHMYIIRRVAPMMKMTLGIPMMSEGQGAIKNGVKHKITIKILLMVLLTFILYLRWFSIIIFV